MDTINGRYSTALQFADDLGVITPSRPGYVVGVSVNAARRTNVGCASNSTSSQTDHVPGVRRVQHGAVGSPLIVRPRGLSPGGNTAYGTDPARTAGSTSRRARAPSAMRSRSTTPRTTGRTSSRRPSECAERGPPRRRRGRSYPLVNRRSTAMALFGKGGGASGGLKAGFREMKWGDQPRPEMEVLDDHGDEKFCRLQAPTTSPGTAHPSTRSSTSTGRTASRTCTSRSRWRPPTGCSRT